jgi:hypothetical protein
MGNGIWETGAWYVSETRAAMMVGATIHLHRTTADPSFLAGKIIGFERRNYTDPRNGKTKLRTYFLFRNIPGMEGATTSPDHWLQSGVKWIP